MLRILATTASKGDGAVNEDLFGYCGETAWLLDGATGVAPPRLDPKSDAAWLVRQVDEYLTELIYADPQQPMLALVKRVIAKVKDDYQRSLSGIDEQQLPPSAACIVARQIVDKVEFFAFGDCAALFETLDGKINLIDGDTDPPLDENSIRQLVSLQKAFPKTAHDEIVSKLKPVLRQTRSRMNSPDGYWILSTDETAADNANCEASKIGAEPLVLMSDGFLRGRDMLGGLSLRAFYDLVLNGGPAAVLNDIRNVEKADADCRKFPRFKVHDDATCAVISFE